MELDLPHPDPLAVLDLQQHNPKLETVTFEEMKSFGLRMEQTAQQCDARIENVPYVGVSRGGGFSMIRNSNGVFYQSRQNSISAWTGVVAKDGETRKMGVYSRGGRSFDFNAEVIGTTAVERAIELLGAEPV